MSFIKYCFKYTIILMFMNGCTSSSIDKEHLTATIIALEKKALEMWNNGNPSGFLELSSNDVVYIDPFFEKKLEGKEELRSYYEKIRGQIKVDTYEMIQPVVQLSPEMAVLTYNLTSYSGDEIYRWNCTEVYRLNSQNEWKIIHTHWSFIQPNK